MKILAKNILGNIAEDRFFVFSNERGARTNWVMHATTYGNSLSKIFRRRPMFFINSFHWESTPEGRDFWLKLENEWVKIVTNEELEL